MGKSNGKKAPVIDIGISEKDRAAIARGLSKLLADTYTLYLTTHNFHWKSQIQGGGSSIADVMTRSGGTMADVQ